MKTKLIPLLCATLLALPALGQAQNTKPKRSNPMAPIRDVVGLPRVLLIGDSISIGYTLPTRELLKGKANVHRIPTNGGPTTKGLVQIDSWLGDSKWNVIHFNWGLHDLKFMPHGKRQVTLVAYEKNLDSLVRRLKQTGAKLIWRNTTPVPEAKVRPQRIPADVVSYNAAAKRVMQKHRVPIHDLYSFALARLERIQLPANVHFTPVGSTALADEVAKEILDALK
ncbi:MAG: SGNH/GDSL hydrolase family protein [Verrucomicrobia bacterium]|nr:SGNH/GDSL hydrolase family protein [Verrucomicrobiota bacterium]MBT5621642.1 SGNH/GDSL hydrolase family protein [Verrucomicrobiota bacterium]MBT6659179.1 SGNH/GDSL hydrolase family protein [Verrucomicrobiota bacterium]